VFAEHKAAVLALLDPDPIVAIYDGVVPKDVNAGTNPYWVAYFFGGYPDLKFQGTIYTFRLRIVLHCVGGNGQATAIVSDRGAGLLLDVTPTVSGRSCYPIRWEDSQPPQRDETTGSTVMDQIDQYVLDSIPG
jgi:hypothetical protein